MDKDIFFSVCIPTYNRAYTLERCLDSLVDQTYKNFEVLLIDDGSIDDTEELVKKYFERLNIRYFKKKNGGKHTALNVGIENATNSTMFKILDSDDLLVPDALEKYYNIWEGFNGDQKEAFCGIMGKCNYQNGTVVGKMFPTSPYVSSYIKYHFIDDDVGDCCECIRTDLIKKYRFPEPPNTKFVPEFYIFDQIGINYKLYCVNDIFATIEYLADGITRNAVDFVINNCVGFSYGTVCHLEKVLPYCKIPIKKRWELWNEYWWLKSLDKTNSAAKVNKISVLGLASAILFFLRKIVRGNRI